ncbi:MAG: hypothetical protein QS748_02905 [Candidatus Endonucleobacter bathymodioli]|uniref:Uncharacterized protein n=1 Tax=Candidatus Endonucleibacter bathymodioli TaxID=539814 RepID=A0AA90SX13_9GAMM|nr:hypothetical protein [Candidatus Endonucleobacter bathymodioli]
MAECPYTLECKYSDNGTEYKGTPEHDFVALSKVYGIGQKCTLVRLLQTKNKADI